MDLNEAKNYLESFLNHELFLQHSSLSDFHLDRIRKLCDSLGNPQDHLKIIHVAGSKGKGSICSMIAYILRSAGYRVGLYTSPHLYDYKERIRILDDHYFQQAESEIFADTIDDKDFYEIISQLKPFVTALKEQGECGEFTFYEIMTALALVYFHQKNVDYVCLETGLGGRLDATNIVKPFMCVLSSISFEHVDLLGDTIEKIAEEKAAIIKSGCQLVVIEKQLPEAAAVIESRCQELGVPFINVVDHCQISLIKESFDRQSMDIKTGNYFYEG